MTDTPRVIFVRHGPTEWSEIGRHTGRTDIPLTSEGEAFIAQEALDWVGKDKTVKPARVARVYTSPRTRAQQTMRLFLGDHLSEIGAENVFVDERLAEWDYGEYEGLTPKQIRAQRPDGQFFIWRDGCPGGEQPEDVERRLDALIADIRAFHAECLQNPRQKCDILVFAHGHSLRAFVHRWLRVPLANYLPLVLPTGGVGMLTYEHDCVDEPALLLGR